MNCPECNEKIEFMIKNFNTLFHFYEMCTHCGYVKTYIDYKDVDTKSINRPDVEY